jgi:RNA polymerase sigma factor (sigma-70 family)
MNAALLPRVRALLDDRRAEERSDAELLRAFVGHRDEAAFAALVRRHGPLVLATARRVVGNSADAEDVFQATFLLLARQASTIRNPAAVGGWLHGVASRMARTARRAAARRRSYESRVPEPLSTNHCNLSWSEVQSLFETELARLPDRYRVPFVLCALEGESRADVARRLGIKEGTISSRLAEAKRQLQQRLSARGVSLAAVLGAVSLPVIGVSAELIDRTIRVAATGQAPAAVSLLVKGGFVTLPKSVAVVGVLVIGSLIAGAGGGDGPRPPAKDPPSPKATAPAKLAVRGKLLDADGKPIADVPVRIWSFRDGDKAPEPVAKTAADGSFSFIAEPQDAIEEARVVLAPPGKPAHWLPLSEFTSEQTLRLPADDIAFTGRIVSLENQPLKGITVDVVRVSNIAEGELAAWLDKNVAMRKEKYWLNEIGLVTLPGGLVASNAKATTDAEGKFKLTGFGRDRVLSVRVYGPKVETKFFWVVTRTGEPKGGYIQTEKFNHGVYGPDVNVMLAPSRPLVGTVRDAKSGKPVEGVRVSEVNSRIAWTTTDKDGKYRLEGVPKKKNYGFTVSGAKGLPYFDYSLMWVADVAGLDALETNLNIDRGLELTGRVVDESGRPVRAEVFYSPLDNNPNAKDRGRGIISSDGWKTKPDGTFYLTVWPGKGVIDVRANDGSKYASVDVEKILSKLGVRSRPVSSVHALIPIDADEAKPETLSLTITLENGVNRKGSVVGPDGKPMSGVVAAGLRGGLPGPMKSSEFTIGGLGATSRRLVLFMDADKKLGAVQPVSGTETDPLAIKLQPLGSATGEVQRDDKSPWAGLNVTAVPYMSDADKYDNLPYEILQNQGVFGMRRAPWWKLTKRAATTDAKGRFRLDGLMPGLEYTIFFSDGDLGEPDTLVTSKSKVTVEWGKRWELGVMEKRKR